MWRDQRPVRVWALGVAVALLGPLAGGACAEEPLLERLPVAVSLPALSAAAEGVSAQALALSIAPGRVSLALTIVHEGAPEGAPEGTGAAQAIASLAVEDHRLAGARGQRVEDPGGTALPVAVTIAGAPAELTRARAAFTLDGAEVSPAVAASGLSPAALMEALAAAPATPPAAPATPPAALLPLIQALGGDAAALARLQPLAVLDLMVPLPAGATVAVTWRYAPVTGTAALWPALLEGATRAPPPAGWCLAQNGDLPAWRLEQRAWAAAWAEFSDAPPPQPEPRVIRLLPAPPGAAPLAWPSATLELTVPAGWLVVGCLPGDLQPGAGWARAGAQRRLTLPAGWRLEAPLTLAFVPSAASADLLPGSGERLLDPDEVRALAARYGPGILRYARNEIFARHGYVFRDPALQRWFSRQSWYRPTGPSVELSDVERANVGLIQGLE